METYEPTIEDSYQKTVHIGGLPGNLRVLDTSGSPEYAVLRNQEIEDGEGFILVYSITDRGSFERIQSLYDQIIREKEWNGRWSEKYGLASVNKPHPSLPITLIANKSDEVTLREVSTQEGQSLARKLNCRFFETSAKYYTNVGQAFNHTMLDLQAEKSTEKASHEPKPSVDRLRVNTGKGKLRQRIRIRWPSS